MSASASPDHLWIAVDLLGSIWVLPYRGGEAQVAARDGWMPTWAPNDQEITFLSADVFRNGVTTPSGQAVPGVWAVDTRSRDRLIMSAKDSGMPSAVAWNASGRQLAVVAGNQLFVAGRRVSNREDVFPFRPQWLTAERLLYTADGRIKRRAVNPDVVVDVPFRATVTLQRTTYAIA